MTTKLNLPAAPRRFEDFWGEDEIIRALQINLQQGSRHLILAGPSGSGKTALARVYARAAECWNRQPNGSPCLTCDSCKAFESRLGHPDYHELDCAKQGTKEEILNLIDVKMAANPMLGNVHVGFLDEMSLPARAAWIETPAQTCSPATPKGRCPRGQRGLKHHRPRPHAGPQWSLPARAAWIETH